jgi:PAS domain S-box-containing protein
MSRHRSTRGRSIQDKPIADALQQTTVQLRRHEAILKAVSTSAAMLLRASAPEPILSDVLRLVASAAGASRAHLFKMETTASGPALATDVLRWEAPGFAVPPAREHVEKEDMSAVGIASWTPRLAAGEIIVGKICDFGETERSFLAAQGVLAILVVPIFIDGRWWGQIGLDDCQTEREWMQSEIDTFKTLAEIIGASLAWQERLAELADANRIIENSPTILFRFGTGEDVPLLYVSQNISQYGYSPEELLRSPTRWARIVHPDDFPTVRADFGKLIAGKADHSRHEFRLMKPDGSAVWFDGRLNAVRDSLGRLIVVEGFGADIADRKQAETAKALLAAIVESSSDAIMSETLTGTITSWNRGAEQMYGYRSDEIIGRSVHEIACEDRRTEIDEVFEKLARGERVAQYETFGVRKDGTRIALSLSLSSVRDSAGNIVGASTIARDITQQKAAREQALRASLYARSLIEASLDPMVTVSRDGRIIDVNQAAVEMTGVPREALIDDDISRYFTEPEKARQEHAEVLAKGFVRDHEMAIRSTSGRITDVLYNASTYRDPDGEVIGVFAAARDITEQKRAAEALAYRDRLLHAVTVGTTILVDAESLDQGMPEVLRIVGETMHVDRVTVVQSYPGQMPPAALRCVWQVPDIRVHLDQAVFAALPMDPAPIAVWQAPLHERKPVIVQLATSEGPIRTMFEALQNKSTLLMPIFTGDKLWGNVGIDSCAAAREWTVNEIHTLETLADVIGALILHNEERLSLEKSEERFRVVSATAQDAIIMIDPAARIGYWNPAAERILGYSAEEVAGRPIHDFLVPARFREKAAQGMAAFAATGQGPVLGKTLEAVRLDEQATAACAGQFDREAVMTDLCPRCMHNGAVRPAGHAGAASPPGRASTGVIIVTNQHHRRPARRFEQLHGDVRGAVWHDQGDIPPPACQEQFGMCSRTLGDGKSGQACRVGLIREIKKGKCGHWKMLQCRVRLENCLAILYLLWCRHIEHSIAPPVPISGPAVSIRRGQRSSWCRCATGRGGCHRQPGCGRPP